MVNAVESFKTAILATGLQPPDTIQPGKFHRFPGIDKKRGNKAGWCLLFDDLRGGEFGDFSATIKKHWQADNERTYTAEERAAFKLRIEAERQQWQAEQQQRHKDAADKAAFIWSQAKPITAQSEHPYLVAKRIQPHTARLYGDALVIPIYSQNKQLVNLQLIQSDGTKRFLSGGKKKHCFSVIGKPESGRTILICEGWATGASLRDATGHFVVVALDAGNLEAVALVMRCLYPAAQIVIAGDNDESGTGQKAARAAALAVGGKYILPAEAGTDWNDAFTKVAVNG